MKIELKDVLHLYLGCDVELNNGGSKVYNRILVGCSNMDYSDLATIQLRMKGHSFAHSNFIKEDRVKLILRPLSDMSVDEAWHFALIVLNNVNLEEPITEDEIFADLIHNDGGNMLDDNCIIYIDVSARCFGGGIAFRKDGSISLVDENNVEQPIDNIAFKIQYLLKQGFDLFNLHENGFCLYKTDLK